MLKRLYEKHKEKKAEKERLKLEKTKNTPTYKLGDLYIGEIVFYKSREDVSLGKVDHYYKEVKKFAFFTESGYKKYCHIKSQQNLYDMCSSHALVGDYAVNNVKSFTKTFPLYLRENNITETSKVSFNFIIENEEKINKELAPELEICELFK